MKENRRSSETDSKWINKVPVVDFRARKIRQILTPDEVIEKQGLREPEMHPVFHGRRPRLSIVDDHKSLDAVHESELFSWLTASNKYFDDEPDDIA